MVNLNKNIVIAVDGEPASGKGTLSKALAKHFNITYIDTGAMFRAVTYYFLSNNICINEENISNHINNIAIHLENKNDELLVYLNETDITKYIRTPEIAANVYVISSNKVVRQKLVDMQRDIAKKTSIVADGQDMGSKVFREADVKIFLICDINERSKRRMKDFEKQNIDISFEKVKDDLIIRTKSDYTRKESPLKKAEDAIIIDTTNYTKEETLKEVIKIVEKRVSI